MKGAFLNYFGSLWILGLLKVSIDLLWSLLPDRKKTKQLKVTTIVAVLFHKAPAQSVINNKPGTAQVGAISKAQKDSKTTFSTTGDNKSSQKTKKLRKKIPNFF